MGQLCTGDGVDAFISLTLVVSLEGALNALQSGDNFKKTSALKTLGQLGAKGGKVTIDAVVNQLDSRDGRVRAVAVETLSHIAHADNQHLITDALKDRIEHRGPTIRATALKVLGQIAEKGNKSVIDMVAARLEDEVAFVRAAAEQALGQLSNSGVVEGQKIQPRIG